MLNNFYNKVRNTILYSYSLRKFIYLLFSQHFFYSSKLVNFIYDRKITRAQNFFFNKPGGVEIELTSHCNVACGFCPHPKMERTKGIMSIELIKKIIDDCSTNGINDILFCGFGEPLLDKRLPEIILYAKEKKINRTRITTTGYLLNKDLAKKIFSSGLDEISLSVDATTSVTYDQVRKIKTPLKNHSSHFDVISDNIKDLVSLFKEENFNTRVFLRFLVTNNNQSEVQEFQKKFANLHDKILTEFWFNLHNWTDSLQISPKPKGVQKPCHNLWTGLIFRYNGDVSLCCLDYENKEVMGNIKTHSISEIWQNEKFKRFRALHNKRELNQINLCKDCHIPYLKSGNWI